METRNGFLSTDEQLLCTATANGAITAGHAVTVGATDLSVQSCPARVNGDQIVGVAIQSVADGDGVQYASAGRVQALVSADVVRGEYARATDTAGTLGAVDHNNADEFCTGVWLESGTNGTLVWMQLTCGELY